MLETISWILFAIVVYTYAGYAVLLKVLVSLKKSFIKKTQLYSPKKELPRVCLFVTAYNEVGFVEQKIENSFKLNYPKEKIQYLWMTDGSDDGTPELLRKHPLLQVEHLPARRGKIHAMNRGMQFVKTPIVIFSDSNTILSENAVTEIVRHFEDEKVGCVAGEKRILKEQKDTAAASGENMYWRLESCIKKMDAELSSSVGAAGELFAIRTELFEKVEEDTLLDDFIISLRIAQKGFRIAYAPAAYAAETASASVREELKRKTRIAAGGMQTIFRLPGLFNPFKNGWLSFQYFSHKVLRWTLAPFSFFLFFFINFLILLKNQNWISSDVYAILFWLQVLMYLVALTGWLFENKRIRMKLFFVPFYFIAINYASIKGVIRYFRGRQTVVWEKSKRA